MKVLYLLVCICAIEANPLEVASNSFMEHGIVNENRENQAVTSKSRTECAKHVLDVKDARFLKDGDLFIKFFNVTVNPSRLSFVRNGRRICFVPTLELRKDILNRCQKWIYEKHEFRILPNMSVMLNNDLLEDGTFKFKNDGNLLMCAAADYEEDNDTEGHGDPHQELTDSELVSVYIGNVGCIISVVALLAHISIFILVPALWSLPGYNLLALSVAFLMAYAFRLIGQIPQVLGTFCVVSGILQQYFFLVVFFGMNVLSFDVWRTLKMATERLLLKTESARRRQFMYYSMYMWLSPFAITLTSVAVEYAQELPNWIKPQYGRSDHCWLTNNYAKAVFFSFPAFTLFIINGVLFGMTAFILKNNTMKDSADNTRQSARLNFVLYIRLAMMMGVTWLVGGIALLSNSTVLWLLFDIFNSLQGLFLFLLFTCSRKVFNHLKDRMSAVTAKTAKSYSDKTTSSVSAKSESK